MNIKTKARLMIITTLFGYAVFSGYASAAPFDLAAPVVPDPILAKMVGKGVIGGHIVYFGVQMQTNWTAPGNNAALQGNLNVALNSSNNVFVPTITYSVHNGQLPPTISNPGSAIDGAGLANIKGVSQGIQIAGQGNGVQNAMTLNVVNGTPSTPHTGSNLMPGTTQQGDVTMTVQPGQLSMLINNGANTVQQGIGAGGAYQLAQIASNGNLISNTMHMTLGMETGAVHNISQQQMQSILQSAMPPSMP
ncbi:hypothetical protein AB4090_09550 [Acidithiobacillus sp. IBUN Pt1247-S3]|uniref:hypothetical protein n=1 Tax=Acidithiobacillus sp. IBUN Pt1247-S3 TaxID=3166642 RepID=UPI0034E456F2